MSAEAIKRLLSALNNHSEVIAEAYLNNGRVIPPDQSAAIDALLQQGMAWFFDQSEGVHLSTQLVALLDRVVRSDRRHRGSNNVAALWDDLRSRLVIYRQCKEQADIEFYRAQLHELSFALIDEIRQTIANFGRAIDRGFAFATSPLIRLQENELALQKAKALVEMMEGAELTEFQAAAAGDHTLRPLFFKHLPNEFYNARADLRRIQGDLGDLITKIREEQALSSLLRLFQNHYEAHPGFVPEEPPMPYGAPPEFNVATGLVAPAIPNIYDDQHRETLADLVESLGSLNQKKTAPKTPPEPIRDATSQTEDPPVPDELTQAATDTVGWVISTGSVVAASSLYADFQFEEPYDLWLYTLLAQINGLPPEDAALLDVQYAEIPDPIFTGNWVLNDLQLGPVHA